MWLHKPGATVEDYRRICDQIGRELELPLSFEGRYKWIVFLNSKIDSRTPVLNRYYGVLEDGTLKVRGIELRRHDTPGIVSTCQSEMLGIFSRAQDSIQFRALIPEALSVLEKHVARVREERVPLEDLVISKNISKNPHEYSNLVPQALAAKRLVQEGREVHAGQSVSFILSKEKGALPAGSSEENTTYDWEEYMELLVASAENLLLPFGYDKDRLRHNLPSIYPRTVQLKKRHGSIPHW